MNIIFLFFFSLVYGQEKIVANQREYIFFVNYFYLSGHNGPRYCPL